MQLDTAENKDADKENFAALVEASASRREVIGYALSEGSPQQLCQSTCSGESPCIRKSKLCSEPSIFDSRTTAKQNQPSVASLLPFWLALPRLKEQRGSVLNAAEENKPLSTLKALGKGSWMSRNAQFESRIASDSKSLANRSTRLETCSEK